MNRTRPASGKLTLHRVLEGFFFPPPLVLFCSALFADMQEMEVIVSQRGWGWSPSSLPCSPLFQPFFPTWICPAQWPASFCVHCLRCLTRSGNTRVAARPRSSTYKPAILSPSSSKLTQFVANERNAIIWHLVHASAWKHRTSLLHFPESFSH